MRLPFVRSTMLQKAKVRADFLRGSRTCRNLFELHFFDLVQRGTDRHVTFKASTSQRRNAGAPFVRHLASHPEHSQDVQFF